MPLPKDEPSRVPVVVPDPTQAACAIGPDVRSLGVRNGPPRSATSSRSGPDGRLESSFC
jgi:hypothetical protein